MQHSISEQLFAWVDHGPPRQTPRDVFGVQIFDDELQGGFRVTYIVDDAENYMLIIRIRKSASWRWAQPVSGRCGRDDVAGTRAAAHRPRSTMMEREYQDLSSGR